LEGRREGEKKSTFKTVNRTAEEPGKTLNVDLCFVPAEHMAEIKLPAVSGSSGHLVVERSKDEEPKYPGQVFENPLLDYDEAMQAYVEASVQPKVARIALEAETEGFCKAKIRQLRQAESRLRDERRGIRLHRQQEDEAWKKLREQHRSKMAQYDALPKAERRSRRREREARKELWKELRRQQREAKHQRIQEDEIWQEQRLDLRQRMSEIPIVTAWIAILVITDNCSRQCLGLPLFVAGSSITADMVVAALRTLLPPELHFLISDRGVHFMAQVFEQLTREQDFIHVVIARHRPQSNGIAERFVRTLKEWLAKKTWASDLALFNLLEQFRHEYNDRPHQGLPIPGLSPDEFANRIWLF
jgi:transposase InsO family protein